MTKHSVEDYLKQGIYGPKQLKPAERRLYLGTFRERVIIVLTKLQVGKDDVYNEVINLMEENSDAQLLLNGHMNYSFLSKYIKHATDIGLSYTVVTNADYNSEYGLVLAHNYAINKDDIYINDELDSQSTERKQTSKIKAFFKRLFNVN